MTDRNQYRFPIDRNSPSDGYDKVRWLMDQEVPWGLWRFTAHAIWINQGDPGDDLATLYKLTFGGL